ncbi:hypothetical protein PDIG_33810 [Penicillium digitatum PHI26]|uniref:Uncharacterized protein n=2 Tax=Penicillium digitatum TaxID=36651 RepID=K9FX19_PEND2|nr:hypothetical protein PDIP_53390 [Penicillium digitatum Pd1]EKV12102.1 hypothetical protein PDIP_53390 [Penicillium digitatum Pd1]EKV14220.1 hypothetical protein PDIG_33810 [Penicillium digitatum PHI26]
MIIDNSITVNGKKPKFDSIVDFLDWYSSWLEHVDLEEVRENLASSLVSSRNRLVRCE